eukprot:3933227-Rhodomonas_salina.1
MSINARRIRTRRIMCDRCLTYRFGAGGAHSDDKSIIILGTLRLLGEENNEAQESPEVSPENHWNSSAWNSTVHLKSPPNPAGKPRGWWGTRRGRVRN